MDCGFQSGAFQSIAFQVCVEVVEETGVNGRRNLDDEWRGVNREEEFELKLSQLLAEQLQKQLIVNKALLEQRLEDVNKLTPFVEDISKLDPLAKAPADPVLPPKKYVDPVQMEILKARLQAARQAKEEKKQVASDKREQLLKNLAKARKAKAKKNK